ncbi:ATP-binding protein [Bradyrhizobium sp.]|jgi:predicted ATPase|uniref:ATP-binding protein n=1 Tax=Bradyrhizobium sp. TaxID=376 RepID=UPI003C260AD4
MGDENRKVLSFGPFELSIDSRRLTNGTTTVSLGARAMDILISLVEQPGAVVGKRDLLERVWPNQRADEVSLRVHISALRRALAQGDPSRRYIANVPGRGYGFIVPIATSFLQTGESEPARHALLPARLERMVGRNETVATIKAKLAEQKFVTIVGPGGIGKTTVAVAVAHEMRSVFDGEVRFVDLSPLDNDSLVAPAVASAFGLAIQTTDVLPLLIDRLAGTSTLLVLDSCEHLIDGASALAEKLFGQVTMLNLLVTSREALRAEGENVHELSALAYPAEDQTILASDALKYPAVQLLVDRVKALQRQFDLRDADAPVAAGICRRLDGVALAIELAAGRVDVYGLDKTASLLDGHMNLSWAGRRTAMPRHQTLNATLEWSYDLLDRDQRRVLNRLSVFSGGFTFEAAIAVVADDAVDEAKVADCLWELRSKSMIAVYGQNARLRLLDTTRAFAAQRLAEGGEQGLFRRRHALYFSDLFRQGASMDVSGWPKALAVEVGNLRAAMNWAFSSEGDAKVGVDLAAASASTWTGMALLTECRQWMAKAIGCLDVMTSPSRQEMIIQSALASSMMFTLGMTEESYAGWAKARLIAEDLGDVEYQLASLLVLWAHRIRLPRYAEAIELAESCGEVAEASGDRGAIATASYMRGVTYHHTGRLSQAETMFEASLHHDVEAARHAIIDQFGYDRKTDALAVLANVVWLRGAPEQAQRLGRMSIAEARQLDQAVPLCVALTWAAFTAYLTNPDDGETDALANELVEHAGKHSVDSYYGFGLAMQALRRVRQGEVDAANDLLYSGLEKLSAARYGVFHPILQAEFARCLSVLGHSRRAASVFERAEINIEDEKQLFVPELIRIRGELALRGAEGLEACKPYFRRTLEMSERRGSLSWTLRTATSLAIAETSDAGREEAKSILRAALAKFRDESDTFDLRLAHRVLDGSYWRDHEAEH